jgi:hypothetical protein
MIQGRMTGKVHQSPECGNWPEFEVLEFKPWNKVRRCASPGSADLSMLLYTGDLPDDRYAPEDFVDGPQPPLLDDESCRSSEPCAAGEHHIMDCAGEAWCCRLEAKEEQKAP